MLRICLVFAFVLVSTQVAFGKETDNFTQRDRVVKDSLEPLDEFTNKLIDAALLKANEAKLSCDRKVLFAAMDKKLGATPLGVVEDWAEHSPQIERLQADANGPENIYHGFNGWKYPLLKVSGIDNSIHVAGHVIGTDKLGHFMAEGLHTYRVWREKGSIEAAMAWGVGTEESYFGLQVSGVKSFGDLSANYAGAHFWASLVDGKDPYFVCRQGKFAKVREFSWKDYVTDAWDEAINCSQFSVSMGATYLRNLARKNMTCPVQGSERRCQDLIQLPDANLYLSPACTRLATLAHAELSFDPATLIFHKSKGRSGD